MDDPSIVVAQRWFEFMANAGETRDARHYFDAEEEASSRSMLQAAREASGETAFQHEIAQQMNIMSDRERVQRLEEMHGIHQMVNESPEMIDSALNQFGEQVMIVTDREWYNRAVEMDRDYIEGRKFRLMFLRAELFNATRAVKRMLLFLEKKAQFFGANTIGRPLLLSDLDQPAKRILQSGDFQILPYRDRAGRPVIWQSGAHCGKKDYEIGSPMFQAWFYMHIVLFEEDEDTQKRGAVLVHWWMETFSNVPPSDHNLYNEAYYHVRWLPMRPYISIHVCMPDTPSYQIFYRIMVALTVPEIRYHHKLHPGVSCDVVMNSLRPFGIPTDLLPVTSTGSTKNKELQKWYERREKKDIFLEENPGAPFDKIELPGIRDVLFAKGKPYQSHLGNQEYLIQINRLLPRHEAENRRGKRDIVLQVIQRTRNQNAQFLVKDKDDGWWVAVPERDLLDKVSKAFSNASSAARTRIPRNGVGNKGTAG